MSTNRISREGRTYWQQIAAYLSTEPLVSMYEYRPQIREAVALITHAGPAAAQMPALVTALRLLVDASCKVAHDNQYIEPSLTKLVNLLHEHIAQFGLMPDDGRWILDSHSGSAESRPLLAMLYPVS